MASLDTSMQQEELIGEKYRLGPVIGSGGIATVHRATHLWTEREVAVKLLDPTLPHFEELRAGFLREARATVQLNHPNVVDVLDMGEDGWDTVYMVMELLDGPTLRDVLHERGKLSEEDTLAILFPLLDALEKAHELGIIHRDFKPDNIMLPLDAYGAVTPKLLDFGIAKIVRDAHSQSESSPPGVIMGTPEYMSPEQARDHRELIGPHTDVWGVAVVWYECLTGHAPFEGERAEDVLQAVCEAPIDFSEVPHKYVPVLRDALHRLPGFRMASVSDLKERIEKMGVERATVPPAPASLSSVPAPMPLQSPGESSKPVNGTLVGLGPDQLFAPTPAAVPLESEVVRLPTKSNRAAWIAGLSLAVAVGLAAWWTVRDRGGVASTPSDVELAEPAALPDDVQLESEREPIAVEQTEDVEPVQEVERVDEVEETLVEPDQEVIAELEEPDADPPESVGEPEAEPLAAIDDLEAEASTTSLEEAATPDDPAAEPPAAREEPEATETTEKPVETPTAEEPKTAPKKPKRAKPRKPKAPKSQPPPDLVTEW